MGPVNVAQAYKQRWQIEILFKRLKQNLKFTDFLGDNENAIRIQIWCALIADLLVTIKRKLFSFKIQPAYSTMVGLVRLHLMRYVDLKELLLSPDDPTLFGSPPTQQLTFFNFGPP
ncbi:MAG: transposase [Flavobacteriales bacterium]|nr:transposase [Flavobacteriales bacterium]MBK6946233.1 transposase [Flavobacteriales bacterium]MBK9537061.1 transposase [Flavobacteriales bacterium]